VPQNSITLSFLTLLVSHNKI